MIIQKLAFACSERFILFYWNRIYSVLLEYTYWLTSVPNLAFQVAKTLILHQLQKKLASRFLLARLSLKDLLLKEADFG